MVRLIGFGLILVLPLKLCKLNMTNNNCINEHKGSKVFFFFTKQFKMHCTLCRISASRYKFQYLIFLFTVLTLPHYLFSFCSRQTSLFFSRSSLYKTRTQLYNVDRYRSTNYLTRLPKLNQEDLLEPCWPRLFHKLIREL